jgi:hypothetical protein
VLRLRVITGLVSVALVAGLAAPCFARPQPGSASEPCCPEEMIQAACHNGQVADACCRTGETTRNVQTPGPWASAHKQMALTPAFIAPGALPANARAECLFAAASLSSSSPPPLRALPLLI